MPWFGTSVRAISFPGIFLLAAAFDATISPACADSSAKSDPAESYIAEFFRATAETAVAPQSDQNAANAVKILLRRAIPLDETARFMLGRNWPSENQEAGTRFQEQFQDFVADTVTRGLRANPALALEVKGSRPRPDGSRLVLSSLHLPSGSAVPVDWHVVRNPADGRFQITDIAVLGINAAIMLRNIAGTMLADGWTVNEVIPQLRAAVERRAAEPDPLGQDPLGNTPP